MTDVNGVRVIFIRIAEECPKWISSRYKQGLKVAQINDYDTDV
jgi:hypothetical protein